MQVMSNGKVRRSQAEWQEIVGRYVASGRSPEEFCRREEIHLGSFTRWQRKLEAMGTAGGFVPVSSTPRTREAWILEITLPNGCQLRFQG